MNLSSATAQLALLLIRTCCLLLDGSQSSIMWYLSRCDLLLLNRERLGKVSLNLGRCRQFN
ncbi:hypothetical protein M758_7G173800 [Ceratodon purpureus]|uniref:Secreted protein n=1 Tax=Ceratodon purpureus TaxID=3225 RepID=A0A8T0HCV5_CERPU|nr:hypothetical protein KC19_7G176800 [Ceratodon purpureus]KAG0611891.1 hypothetical protein M758_7G173800 [Ceratodon purpureus]